MLWNVIPYSLLVKIALAILKVLAKNTENTLDDKLVKTVEEHLRLLGSEPWDFQ